MRSILLSSLSAVALVGLVFAGCGDSDTKSDAPPSGTGGTGTAGTGTGAGGTGTGAGGTGTGAGGTSSAGASGSGGSAPTGCPTGAKTVEVLTGEVTADKTLTADKDWSLEGIVFVRAGATLSIEPCTTVKGKTGMPGGTLVVQPGGKLNAVGEKDKPIVFTSAAQTPKPGDWGGIVLLGKAPVNYKDMGGNPVQGKIEGIVSGGDFGGSDPADSSGSLKYVRIEYPGFELSPMNELNGLTFGGVGSGTTIDFVQVRLATDDCFEFFGGTVNAKHLVCQYNQDDGIDWDNGFSGKIQFAVVQQDPSIADDTNGFEGDNDAQGSTNAPNSEPTLFNVTLVGKNKDVGKQQYGMLLRRSTKANLRNIIVTGFEAGVDLRDAKTSVSLTNSIFFGNVVKNIAYTEDGSNADTEKDDDAGFNEIMWFMSMGNTETDPMLADPFNANAPNFRPKASLTANAATPPSDGFFDPAAAYIGAFKDGSDDWATGAWVKFSDK